MDILKNQILMDYKDIEFDNAPLCLTQQQRVNL